MTHDMKPEVQRKLDDISEEASKGAKAWEILTDGKFDRRDPPAAMQLAQSALLIASAAVYLGLRALEALEGLQGVLGG